MRGARGALAAALVAALAGCAKPPPPDVDAEMGGAILLPLAEDRADTLACSAGDCADWYRILVPGEGELSVEIKPGATTVGLTQLDARLVDEGGETLAEAPSSSAKARQIRSPVKGGAALVRVGATDPEAQLSYSIRARFKPAPPRPPPAPKFETRRLSVLEVEGRPGAPSFVLLDAGENAALRAGMRGKLVDGGKSLGAIVIQDVYPDGSRARVEGSLAGTITPRTTAEIQVPLAPPGTGGALEP